MKLSLPQQDVYFEQLLYPNEPIYNIGAKIEIKGYLNRDALNLAYVELINQHETYRTIFVADENQIAAKVAEVHSSKLAFVDFSSADNAVQLATEYMQNEFMKPFDLLGGKFLHVFILVIVADDFHYLFSVYHHIITDGWGTSLMFQRLVQNYNELLEFGEVRSEYPFSYKEFIEDDNAYLHSESFILEKNYWVDKFKVLPENLFSKIDNTIQINKSKRKELIVKREVYDQLNRLSGDLKCSTFHLILAILYVYFGRKHQNNDFAIGLPVLNRSKAKYKKTVGLFMGVSPLRIQLDFEASFEELVNEIKNQLRMDYRYQRFPLGKLINELQIFTEKEKLFNITLSYEKQNYATDFKNTQTKVVPLTHQSERVALAIYIREFDESDDVKIDFDYHINYFDHSGITGVVQHFENLIHAVLTSPNKKIKELPYLSRHEEHQLLKTFNDTAVDYPKDKTLIDLFRENAESHPDKVALVDAHTSCSYAELDKLSSQIAAYLIFVCGKQDKSPITILLDRSVYMVAVLIGVLKSGRAYIPLDPGFPMERLRYIIDNSQSKISICQEQFKLEGVEGINWLTLETILSEMNHVEEVTCDDSSPGDTAYIIYTSGSTGNPKGVEIGHQSLVNFLRSIQQKPGIISSDTLFSVTTYSFDISLLEFFAPLLSGATVYIALPEVLSTPHFIIQKLKEVNPTIIQATPSFYQLLFNAGWEGNKQLKVLCGGDLLSERLAEKLLASNKEVWNMYGPTETTIWSSVKKMEQSTDASNIGMPINNTQFYIVDPFLKLKPVGTPGSIYIGGDGLAKGYYRNEQLTNEKFIKNPFDTTGELIYETGDSGKWNEKGEIEFLGRNDNQVKIRGYRIELGDIETQLHQVEGIKEAVVIAKKSDEQEDLLIAYILKDKVTIDSEKIIAELKLQLPYYMVPNTIIVLEEFPLTPNKKVDRAYLSKKAIQSNGIAREFKPPFSPLEKKLSEYWKEVLANQEAFSSTDNFFALGGHSLSAVKLINLIYTNLSYTVSLKAIFDYPTIASLAVYLQTLDSGQFSSIATAEHKDFYSITPNQYPIWLASLRKNSSAAYNMSAAYVLDGAVDMEKMTAIVRGIIEKYEILRTNFFEINGTPFQKINPPENSSFSIPIKTINDENVDAVITELANREFDLEKELLVRAHILYLKTGRYILLFSTHHAIMDGLSLEIFIKEFIKRYKEYSQAGDYSEKALALQFKDYTEWYNKTAMASKTKNKLLWEQYLEQYQPKYSFDRDFDLEHDQQTLGKYAVELSLENTFALKKMAANENITFYSVLVALLNVLIYRLTGHMDICIWTIDSGRNKQELSEQMGMFVKSLVLRTRIENEQTVRDILKNTQLNLLKVNDYSDLPYELASRLNVDIMLVYQNPDFFYEDSIEVQGLKLTSYPVNNKYSRIPLVFNLYETGNRLKGSIDYNADCYDAHTIQLIASAYEELLVEVTKKPLEKINWTETQLTPKKNMAVDFEFDF